MVSVAPSLREHLREPLLSETAILRISELIQTLPTSFVSYYVECRLGRDADQVDLLAGCSNRRRLFESCRTTPDRRTMSTVARRSWDALARLVDGWCHCPTLNDIPCLWIEFDDVDRSDHGLELSLAACLEPGYPHEHGHGPDNEAIAHRVIEVLADRETEAQVSGVQRYFAALPPDARIIHLSPMIGRRESPLKIYGRAPATELTTFLDRAGWSGPASRGSLLIDDVWRPCSDCPDVYFDVAVAESAQPTIAVVFSPPELGTGDPQRTHLLQHLVRLGICDADKAAGLAHWVGDTPFENPDVPWPCRISRWLDIKVVSRPDGLSAKAYLGFRPYRTLF